MLIGILFSGNINKQFKVLKQFKVYHRIFICHMKILASRYGSLHLYSASSVEKVIRKYKKYIPLVNIWYLSRNYVL